MRIGGHEVTMERLELLRELCATPGLGKREIARRLDVHPGLLSVMKAAARRQGIAISTVNDERGRKPTAESCPAWQALPDKPASEWGRADLPRCRCGLLLPCAFCVPDVGRELQTARREA